MADGYWNRQQLPLHHLPPSGALKRPRTGYDLLPSGHKIHSYLARDDNIGGPQTVKDTKTIGSAYDRFLQNAQLSSFTSGEPSSFAGVALGRAVGGGISSLQMVDAVIGRTGAIDADLRPNGPIVGLGNQLPGDGAGRPSGKTLSLPPDASSTLYVEGLPPDCRKREVAHIFRPFVGYREVRIVSKESKHRGGDPLILCFVDFASPACAATAMSALQGYKMDEYDQDSKNLRLQFSRFPGPRSSSGPRRRR